MKALEDAIKLADLWRAGKMIGGDPYDVCDALLKEVNRLAEVNAELLEVLEGVLKIGRGTSGRIIIDGWQESAIKAQIAKAKEQQ